MALNDTIGGLLQAIVDATIAAWPGVSVTSEFLESELESDMASVRLTSLDISNENSINDEAKASFEIKACFARPLGTVTDLMLSRAASLRSELLSSQDVLSLGHMPMVRKVTYSSGKELSDNRFDLQVEFDCGFSLAR